MKPTHYLITSALLAFILPILHANYSLVWSDEFDYTGLPDPTMWGYDTGGHGWGNNELQFYTADRAENARVEDGHLIITAIREAYQGRNYTSARLVSRNKGDWTYGRFEIRAKLPRGRGTWPAIWMLPTDWEYGGWPASGEIDIMEHVGYDMNIVHGTVHTQAYHHSIGTQQGNSIRVDDVDTTFHVYAMEWRPDRIDVFVDGRKYFTFENEGKGFAEWPFDKRFHLLMNIAVGGNWGGAQGIDNTVYPQELMIDYVRVYEIKDFEIERPEDGFGIFEDYPLADFWVDTGNYIGWAYVEHYPWVYLYRLGKYAYTNGQWFYLLR